MIPLLTGIHHLTAVSGRIQTNHRFYTEGMGMRMVKRSVNQDDVSAYHLFYADAVGTPGTDLTFFDWPMPPERRGTHSIVSTGLRVRDATSLAWWSDRLASLEETYDLSIEPVRERYGRATLAFGDPEGQRVILVVDGGEGDAPTPWERSPVPAEHQIRGLGPVVLSVPTLAPTHTVLTEVMGMAPTGRYVLDRASALLPGGPGDKDGEKAPEAGGSGSEVHVYSMGAGGPHAELHVAVEPGLPPARPGAGGVHHVAFRTPDEAHYDAWASRLSELRIPNSGKVDRFYFRSLYFREPNGILFEIATDGPGFHVDESLDSLGESLALPPFLEDQRADIEAGLKPLD